MEFGAGRRCLDKKLRLARVVKVEPPTARAVGGADEALAVEPGPVGKAGGIRGRGGPVGAAQVPDVAGAAVLRGRDGPGNVCGDFGVGRR